MAQIKTGEAAKLARLSQARIRELMITGALKGEKLGTSWTIDRRSLTAYLDRELQRRREVSAKRARQRLE